MTIRMWLIGGLVTVLPTLACSAHQHQHMVSPSRLESLACPQGTTLIPRVPSKTSWCQTSDGVRHGPLRALHDNGRLNVTGEMASGKKHGLWRSWLPDGSPTSEQRFENGKLHGISVHWFKSCKFWESNFIHDQRDGRFRMWHPSCHRAIESTYKMGMPTGMWRSWHPDGTRASEGGFDNGRESGNWRYWHANGELAACGDYDAGAKIREWKFFDDDGDVFFNWTPPAAKQPDGQACSISADCQSGLCEGPGCEPGEGRCVALDRKCTDDVRIYVGCDGQNFGASGTCPEMRHTRDNKQPDSIRIWNVEKLQKWGVGGSHISFSCPSALLVCPESGHPRAPTQLVALCRSSH